MTLGKGRIRVPIWPSWIYIRLMIVFGSMVYDKTRQSGVEEKLVWISEGLHNGWKPGRY